uniref:Putative transporter n=1 Tax=uncultured Muribaculaceae bacterium TaxID=2301481 RepID=A0A6G8F3M1_9BACT|nr:putative transporter [uncultured Muribaculaceae bacterium]
MEWLTEIFRQNQVIPIFLTLGLGFWLGGLRYKSFSLGPVTATLIVGVVIGQLDIPISDTVKSLAFMLFLFAIGYSVGPQFFRSLKGDGVKQICFALVECLIVIGVTVGICRLFGYNKGIAVGVFAGAQTVSAVIGVGSDTIRSLGFSEKETEQLLNIIPACYAVCYVFGTIGSAWIIANLGPVLLGGLKKVKEETKRLEDEMDSGDFTPDPGQIIANRPVSFRAYRVEADFFNRPRTVKEIEKHLKSRELRHFVERLRINGEIMDPDPDIRVKKGDIIVLSGRRESIVRDASWIGSEVSDHELLTFGTENLPVVVSKSGAAGVTIGELRNQPFMHGVMIHKVLRNEMPMPLRKGLRLERGDVVTLVGLPQDVDEAVPEIGFSDRQTSESDIVFIGLGIAVGCIIGAIVIRCGNIPISLSTSGGAIISGLVLGWLRSRRPSFGHIPRSVIWFMDNAGLNIFIAVVGLSAGPSFISGLKEVGPQLFLVGVACTALPLIISIFIANKLFKFPAAITLGCVAGSRNAVAALGAIQDSLDSTLPVMGYTVTYAVGSVSLILAGMAVALLA